MEYSGKKFYFKGNPYEVVCLSKAKVYGQWLDSIVYKSLYAEGQILYGHIWVRVDDSTPEWKEFLEAINNSTL